MVEQLIVFGTLLAALALFVWGRWRYDVVALLALLTVAVTGVVPEEEVFTGFANPAVITVAAVLVISRSLTNAGLIDVLGGLVRRFERPVAQVAVLTGMVTLLSGFINNVGALALMMPLAIRMARRNGRTPSFILMPLAFGSLLGGMTTLIGTPPNLIIAGFRREASGAPFGMFDFAPVGLGVALAGLAFLVFVGWRLTPRREGQGSREELFDIGNYLTEVRVKEGSVAAGKLLRDVVRSVKSEVVVAGLARGERREPAPSGFVRLREGDVLTVEAEPEALQAFMDAHDLALEGGKEATEAMLSSQEVSLTEAVVSPRSVMEGRSARGLNLRWRYGVNLLGVSRRGQRLTGRLSDVRFQAGDVLLLQLPAESVQDTLVTLGALPLAERGLRLGQRRRVALAVFIFGAALAAATVGLTSSSVALAGAAVAMVLFNLVTLREAYESIDWPIIVLLGALIPVGQALETTGGAALVAGWLAGLAGVVPAAIMLALILVLTMFLSDIINNAAAAILIAPIGIGVARTLGVSSDPFLMAIAIGASCAFLTPIGHQSNTLVMGPGGYKFSDYWRVGLPLEVVVLVVAIPLLLLFWPL
jgi:di/tricarboxylate transporter